MKEQLAEHTKSKSCYSCHKDIDPYGFALESFDPTGQNRTHYRIALPRKGTFMWRPQGYFKSTQVVDSTGEINKKPFTDIVGLKKLLLSKHKTIAYNFAKNIFEYANGYAPTLKQRLELYKMIPDKAEECRLKTLFKNIILYSLTDARDEH